MTDDINGFKPILLQRKARNERVKADIVNQGYEKMKKSADYAGFVASPGSIGGSNISMTVPFAYLPEYASPDRLWYPTDIPTAIRYWRLFYRMDNVFGNVMDMYAELLTSDFQLVGPGVDGEVRDVYEDMIDATNIVQKQRWFPIAYLVDGEVIINTVWNDKERMFTYVGFINPAAVEVKDVAFLASNPFITMKISDEELSILRDTGPAGEKFRKKLTPQMQRMVYQGGAVPLDTDEEVTYIPRKLTPFDMRGTGIASRLWRIFMYEDAIVNASIQTARRHAAPVKVVTVGNAATGWVPPPSQVQELMNLLATAESDPMAWLVWHPYIHFEAWGTTNLAMNIGKEYDNIEKMKLVALGVSKAFLSGEVTYASAEKGLQVFLNRLRSFRQVMENTWWYPRFFRQLAEKNDFIQPTEAELSHHVRIKLSREELRRNKRYIIPTIKWKEALDPQIQMDIFRAVDVLTSKLGIKISKTTAMGFLNLDYEDEAALAQQEQEKEEEEKRRQEDKKLLERHEVGKPFSPLPEPSEGTPVMPEGTPPVPAPPAGTPAPPAGTPAPAMPEGAPPAPPVGAPAPAPASRHQPKDSLFITSNIWDEEGMYEGWHYKDVEGLVEVAKTGRITMSDRKEFWSPLANKDGVAHYEYVLKIDKRLKSLSPTGFVVVESEEHYNKGDVIKWHFASGKESEGQVVDAIKKDEGIRWNAVAEFAASRGIAKEKVGVLKHILEAEDIDCGNSLGTQLNVRNRIDWKDEKEEEIVPKEI